MRDLLVLAWRYLAYHRIKTTILALSMALIVFLPVGLRLLVSQSARSLTARAEATPWVVGAKGSPLELVLNALYFESDPPAPMRYRDVARVTDTGYADAIPLHTRFRAGEFPIVGTSVDYIAFRSLTLAEGRPMAVMGECVLGAAVADALNLDVGARLLSSPENVFDIAGVYPLKMKVVGVLAPGGTPDDRVVLVDVKTSWVIAGLAHGHQDVTPARAIGGDGEPVAANPALIQYNEINPDNLDAFHFHGDPGDFPVTAAIIIPNDDKSATLLQGRYVGDDEPVQIVRPATVMADLLRTILSVQTYVLAAVLVIGLSTLMTAALVFALSLRLRQREMETLHRIGGEKLRVIGLLASEAIFVMILGSGLAAALTLLAVRFGEPLIRMILL